MLGVGSAGVGGMGSANNGGGPDDDDVLNALGPIKTLIISDQKPAEQQQ